MGLRELKAQRTRTAVCSAALELFERQGYDATTMEQIAAKAEIAPTTLYRYFPTKDSTLVSQLLPEYGSLDADVRARPADEPLEQALGQALMTRLRRADDEAEHLLALRRLIDQVPGARARLWDDWYAETADLERAIADRTGSEPSDLWVQLTARTCMTVLQMALDGMRSPHPRSATEHARQIVLELGNLVIPTVH